MAIVMGSSSNKGKVQVIMYIVIVPLAVITLSIATCILC